MLRRHLARHEAAAAAAAADPRRGRACEACHTNKTKCDGGDPCTLCSRRGIACTVRGTEGAAAARARRPVDVPLEVEIDDVTAISGNGAVDHDPATAHLGPLDPAAPGRFAVEAVLPTTPPRETAECTNTALPQDQVARTARQAMLAILRAITASQPKPTLESELEKASKDIKTWFNDSAKAYFEHFHHRWPMLHAPSFDHESEPTAVAVSVIMIGAWLRGCGNVVELMAMAHDFLVDKFFEELVGTRNALSQEESRLTLDRASLGAA